MHNRPIDVQLVTRGARIGPAVKAYARRKVAALARIAPGPVRYARVTLGRAADPAVARPAHAKAVLDLNGRPVRAKAPARRLEEAVDLMEARLRHRLEHLASRRRALHRSSGVAEPASGATATCHPDGRPGPRPPTVCRVQEPRADGAGSGRIRYQRDVPDAGVSHHPG